MPSAFVQGNTGTGASVSTQTIPFPSNNALGNLLVVAARVSVPAGLTVSDSQGNTYVQIYNNAFTSSTQNMAVYYALNCKAGANTVTVSTTSTSFTRVVIGEWSGVSATATVEGPTTFATGTAVTTSTTNNLTTTGTDLLIAFSAQQTINSASAPTVNNGFTVEVSGVATINDITIADLAAAAGTRNATFTYGSNVTWGAGLIAFKPPVIVTPTVAGDGPMISALFPVLMARMKIAAAYRNRKK